MLTSMETDEGQRFCVGRINSALDLLESDPGDARNRRRRFNTIGLWGIAVICGNDEWLILWEPLDSEIIMVHHIVPAP
ncbi:MAG: hypothetical protein ACT4OS_12695 [Acidimicrobiales bacterium]